MFGTGASKEQLVEQHKAWPTRKLLFSAEDFLAQFENPKIDGPLVLITFSQEELVYQLAKDIAALPSKFHYEGKNPFHMGNKFLHKIFEIPVKKYP